ncbi:MAG TPA: hypothetical protein VFE84_04930 [Patescibacteria group bacterium]|nr:hypothetical protein [Patescibacteria group bacterium]
MTRFHMQDLRAIEDVSTSPAVLRSRIGEMILSSAAARAKVETLNPETGEYRVVLQGTLDREATRREER